MGVERVNVLGVGVSAINMGQALQIIDDWVAKGERQYVCVTGVHGVMESQRDPELRRIHNRAGLVTPDGMPLVWISHLRGQRHVRRVYGPDLLLAVCEHSAGLGYRHFFYGGEPGVADALALRLQERFPGLVVAGTYSPPFAVVTAEEDARINDMIAKSGADVVWVGLGTPKQERWMGAHAGKAGSAVMIGVGAAFDFHAGRKRQAPPWMQRSGLEWLFRLLMEPRRLWRRYLVNNPQFVLLTTLQLIGLRRYPLELEE